MKKSIEQSLFNLYHDHFKQKATQIERLPESGSNRAYFRLKGRPDVIGVYHDNQKENEAFIYFAKHFGSYNLPVPKIYTANLKQHIYLQEDLGDTTLFSLIEKNRTNGEFTQTLKDRYQTVVSWLPKFQIKASKDMDFSKCYPRKRFDHQSMAWDLNYFKYYFLKLADIPFDEDKMEKDFQKLIRYLSQAPDHYFMYRDFQSRNIMVQEDKVYFIDFQGGRQGALQYDIASLLYDAKANIPQAFREELLNIYLRELQKYQNDLDIEDFKDHYHGFVLIRIMQAMGAYGYRGFFEGKKHFLKSIPFAINNLKHLLETTDFAVKIPELQYALQAITHSKKLQTISQDASKLTVEVQSFSYKRGIPADNSGHGGGFVFDCRALPNPGRFEIYQHLTGRDQEVKTFLIDKPEVQLFLDNSRALISQAVEAYIKREFNHLSVYYGCTGGQHRSVYAAETIAQWLQNEYDIRVILRHREQE